jgi:hypothetical protein
MSSILYDNQDKPIVNNKKVIQLNTFRRGLNTLLNENEIRDDELVEAKNIMLIGAGVPTKRWGSSLYNTAGATGSVRGLFGYYDVDNNNELLALTDSGYLVKKSGSSYSIISGASWASGYDAQMTQLNDNVYIVNGYDSFRKYNGATILSYATLTVPYSVLATNMSGVSGTYTYSWRISAESEVGETLASTAVTLSNLPRDLSETSVKITWSGSSPASAVKGYVIYGRESGNETFIARNPSNSLTFIDNENNEPALLAETPTSDTTGGHIAKYIQRYDSRLLLAGIKGNPSRLMFSGKSSNAENFHWSKGGGYIDIDKDSGDMITGLQVVENKIIVFKEKSIWSVSITIENFGNYAVAVPIAQLITNSHGAVSSKSIIAVENDVFYLSRDGVYVLGYEPNILNVLRTNELSARVRSFYISKSTSQLRDASSAYIDKKYIITFPDTKQTLVYDRERLAWLGPWIHDYSINGFLVYYDSTGTETWLCGAKDSPRVIEFKAQYKDDIGVGFSTSLKTKKIDVKNWHLFKNFYESFINIKNVSGDVVIKILNEDRSGVNNTSRLIAVSQESGSTSAGWGPNVFGGVQFADSNGYVTASNTNENIILLYLDKIARTIQFVIITSGTNDSYELLGISSTYTPMELSDVPYTWIK